MHSSLGQPSMHCRFPCREQRPDARTPTPASREKRQSTRRSWPPARDPLRRRRVWSAPMPALPQPLAHLRMCFEVLPVQFLELRWTRIPIGRTWRQRRRLPRPRKPLERPQSRCFGHRGPTRRWPGASEPAEFVNRKALKVISGRPGHASSPTVALGSVRMTFSLCRLTWRS